MEQNKISIAGQFMLDEVFSEFNGSLNINFDFEAFLIRFSYEEYLRSIETSK